MMDLHLTCRRGARDLSRSRCLSFIFLLWLCLFAVSPDTADAQDVLVYADYPPMMMGEDAEADRLGFSVDIVREAAKRLGRNVTVQFYPFRRAIKTVQHADDAIQVSMFRNPTREPHYRWLAKTHIEEMVFLTLGTPVNSLEEGRKLESIGVENGSGLDNFLTKAGFTNLERVDRADINAAKLHAGRIDAWALAKSNAMWVWRNAGYDAPLVAGEPLATADVYVATGLGFPADVAEAYAAEIRKMVANGEIDVFIARYIETAPQ